MDKNKSNREAIILLKAISNIKINITTAKDFILGIKSKEILEKKLNLDPYFGILSHKEKKEINKILIFLEEIKAIKINDKIITTSYGLECIKKNEFVKKDIKKHENKLKYCKEEDDLIKKHAKFLENVDDIQKKVIVCGDPKILCVAGAGSGKTTVLTMRIKHLVENVNINPKKILAITFTKKAKENMQEKLAEFGIKDVFVHTFNSFGEMITNSKFNDHNKKQTRIIEHKEKISCVEDALKFFDISFSQLKKEYFSNQQIMNNHERELFRNFVNDIFTIKDYFQNNNTSIPEFYKGVKSDIELAKKIYEITRLVVALMKKRRLRDFTDQLTDAVDILATKKYYQFEHVLVDEYQDINPIQECIIELLKPKNLFCVGDPRQSIYGWRGSRIEFIENMRNKEDVTTIYLNKNYRSSKEIIDIANKIISPMELPDQDFGGKKLQIGEITFQNYSTKEDEALEISKKIAISKNNNEDILILSRTNTLLELISDNLKKLKINHTIKSDNQVEENSNSIILSTVHKIKGLQAKEVYLIGCTKKMFPCLKSENKIIENNKEEEELRLLYVAVTRAKSTLHISYYGRSPSKFIDKELLYIKNKHIVPESKEKIEELKKTRTKLANVMKIPQNLIYSDDEIPQIINCQNIKDLKKILGNRAQRYGDYLLEIIKK